MKQKPLIGVCPLWDETKNSYWMLPGYFDGIMAAGGLPVMLPLTDNTDDLAEFVSLCDGFVISGGQDVSPAVYGEPTRFDNVETCPARDAMEQILLPLILDADKPVLGICRGLQFLNAALQGTLYQDLVSEKTDVISHRQKPPYDMPRHTVNLLDGAPLQRLLNAEQINVNSCHHQAIRTLSPRLKPMAVSPDGLVEAVYLPEKHFVWAVQWHPEFSFRKDANSRKILQAFVDSTKR